MKTVLSISISIPISSINSISIPLSIILANSVIYPQVRCDRYPPIVMCILHISAIHLDWIFLSFVTLQCLFSLLITNTHYWHITTVCECSLHLQMLLMLKKEGNLNKSKYHLIWQENNFPFNSKSYCPLASNVKLLAYHSSVFLFIKKTNNRKNNPSENNNYVGSSSTCLWLFNCFVRQLLSLSTWWQDDIQ